VFYQARRGLKTSEPLVQSVCFLCRPKYMEGFRADPVKVMLPEKDNRPSPLPSAGARIWGRVWATSVGALGRRISLRVAANWQELLRRVRSQELPLWKVRMDSPIYFFDFI